MAERSDVNAELENVQGECGCAHHYDMSGHLVPNSNLPGYTVESD
jgi:hypothetical protein